MPLTLKIKYFNTFLLREKPIVTTAEVKDATATGVPSVLGESNTIKFTAANTNLSVGQVVHGPGILDDVTITQVDPGNDEITISKAQKVEKGVTLTFSNANAYPSSGSQQQADKEWHIEESRIKGEFNGTSVDLGVRAYIVDKKYRRTHRENAMIYSGIFNSRTSINNTNQFSIGENITKSVDIAKGSIQKLYAEDTNLIIFQENKVNGALIDKDAIYTAEGGNLTAAANVVIGQITPYTGEFGIGTNPESFSVYGFRKYFVDKDRGSVLRLSRDGITEISSYGMKDFFRDNLPNTNRIYGMFDNNKKSYVISLGLNQNIQQNKQTYISTTKATAAISSKQKEIQIQSYNSKIVPGQIVTTASSRNKSVRVVGVKNRTVTTNLDIFVQQGETITFTPVGSFGLSVSQPTANYATLGFDDSVNGWTSFYTYKPNFGTGIQNDFFTWSGYNIYKHHSNPSKNTFYGLFQPSTVTIISNQNPSLVKHYKTINYEGTNNWKVIDMFSPAEDNENYNAYQIPGNITGRYFDQSNVVQFAGFTPLENKYYADIKINDVNTITGVQGLTTTGIKGFFTEFTLEHEPVKNDKTTDLTKHAELFSVGLNYEQSLY